MKIKNAIIYVFLFCPLLGCQDKHLPSNATEQISIPKAIQNHRLDVKLSEIAEQIRYIKLETSSESVLESIDKVLIQDPFIYLSNPNAFYQFTVEGQFIRQFGSKGKGPGEFLSLHDFAVNSSKKMVTLYDQDQRKILHFKTDGTFLREYKVPSLPNSVAYNASNQLNISWTLPDFALNNQFSINVYDDKDHLIQQLFDRSAEGITEADAMSMPSSSLTRLEYFNDTLTFWEVNHPYIYRIVDGRLLPRFFIELGHRSKQEEINSSKIEEDKYRVGDLLETSRYLFLTKGLYQNEVHHLLYDKLNQSVNTFRHTHQSLGLQIATGFINDLDGGYPFLPEGLIAKDELYCTFLAQAYNDIKEDLPFRAVEVKDQAAQAAFQALMDASTLEENPIIMIVKMKAI